MKCSLRCPQCGKLQLIGEFTLIERKCERCKTFYEAKMDKNGVINIVLKEILTWSK